MAPPTETARPPTRRRKPLIFLVDDHPTLLDLAEVSLQGDDYEIRKFPDPEIALQAFLKARIKPDLLITDYAMGKLNGIELIERCKKAKPDLKTVIISGTAGAEIVLGAPVKVDRFLGKPYQPSNLAELVRRLLETAAATPA
jgi:DNA-binding NtrC family response regulator